MNILQICANYPPVPGGLGIYAKNLSIELFKLGIDTTILTFKPKNFNTINPDIELDVKRIKVLNLKLLEYPVYGPTILSHINNIVKEKEIDVINSHTRFFTSTYFASLYKKMNEKITFVHTEHGAGPLIHKNRAVSSLCNMYDSTFGKWAIKTADIPIAVGPSSKEFLKKLGCEKKIEIIPNSINCSEFERLSKESPQKKCDEIIITYIGRLVKSKGVHDLIKIFSEIENNYDVRLWIVGSGPDEESFKNLAKALHIKNLDFLGVRNDIPNILSMTNIFVNPSYYDSVPTTILEAGCIGTRVISSNVGDAVFILGDDYPYVYDVNSLDVLKKYLIQVIEESDFKDNKLKNQIHKYFNWEINSKKYTDILNYKLHN